jgi:hypothetical protein
MWSKMLMLCQVMLGWEHWVAWKLSLPLQVPLDNSQTEAPSSQQWFFISLRWEETCLQAGSEHSPPVFSLSGRNLHPGPMHDSKFWRECHLLVPIVGFSHSEKTLLTTHMKVFCKILSTWIKGSKIQSTWIEGSRSVDCVAGPRDILSH